MLVLCTYRQNVLRISSIHSSNYKLIRQQISASQRNSYVPIPNAFVEKMKYHSQMHNAELATIVFQNLQTNQLVLPLVQDFAVLYEIQEYVPLLDSSNMSPKDWKRIAEDIGKYYGNFDGFVILHGTDTMTYTSSALSFMLDGLTKPVILTGAQIPIFETRSDAKDNFLDSLILAATYDIPEVCLCFANKLFRGNRTSKMSASSLNAFSSPNYHTLADIGIHIQVHHHYVRRPDDLGFKVRTDLCEDVAVLTFFPTLTASMIEGFLQPPIKGVVLESYGAGNIPSGNKDIMNALKKIVDRGVLIVNVTQCSQGYVNTAYETGQEMVKIGIISGKDMTVEAALTKLCYVLGHQQSSYEEKMNMMTADLKGELKPTDEE